MKRILHKLGALGLALAAPALGLACASAPPAAAAPVERVVPEAPAPPPSAEEDHPVRAAVVDSARTLLGEKPNAKVVVRDRAFLLDCIGTVSAAWWGAGYDIQRDFHRHQGNGVTRLYRSLVEWGALHDQRIPKPGDIVVWSNTYDRNEDGVPYNDGITHAGIVVQVDEDGTVHYLHSSYSRGVVIAYFNLLHPSTPHSPEGKVWNSPMYLGSNYNRANNPPRWLSGDLWEAFGNAERTAAVLR